MECIYRETAIGTQLIFSNLNFQISVTLDLVTATFLKLSLALLLLLVKQEMNSYCVFVDTNCLIVQLLL